MWFVVMFLVAFKVGSMFDISTYIGRPVGTTLDSSYIQIQSCPMGNYVLVDERGLHCMDYENHHWTSLEPTPLTVPGHEYDPSYAPVNQRIAGGRDR